MNAVVRNLRGVVLAALGYCVLGAQAGVWAQQGLQTSFAQVLPSECGIAFQHTNGASGKRYIVETVIGSLALFDYDQDGLVDVYLINGAPLTGALPVAAAEPAGGRGEKPTVPVNRLYKNLGGWQFRDVTVECGLGDAQYGMGVATADYDNDGDQDVIVSNFGANAFFVNQGDGTFSESAAALGIVGPFRFGAGNCFFDMDADGDLDVYCASYVHFDYSSHVPRTIAGYQFHPGPNDYSPAPDLVFRNNGEGAFDDVSQWSGVARLSAPGMGAVSADFDSDGDMDVFVANDQRANFLLLNDGTGRFTEDAVLMGVAYDRRGKANGNMGVDYADANGDGVLDLLTTTYQDEMPICYAGQGQGFFADTTNLVKWDPGLAPHVTWGIGAFDFDLDADNDVFVACGHFLDNIQFIDDRTAVNTRNYLLPNLAQGRFGGAVADAGTAMSPVASSRGVGFDDLDNDGDIDFVVVNVNDYPTIGNNEASNAADSLAVQLTGRHCNRDAIGAVVYCTDATGRSLVGSVVAGRGYESDYGRQVVFACSDFAQCGIRVVWPGGSQERFTPRSSRIQLLEGTGVAVDR